ncbi:hypothetical protein [Streptomyces sp. 3N207]|uniref:hypothetical protein n=1 Tax=Streptomyces sp. 3N207 TaxID=3457417 RepID=UPI003FD46A39
MKKQASTAMWTAAALAASLLLGACGSDGESKDKIDGAKDGGKKASKSASPSKSSGGADKQRPQYKLAKDAKNVFEETKTGDSKQDEILADNQRRINLVDRIITTGKDSDDLKLYASGEAFVSASKYIKAYADDKYSWAGKTRYYKQQVKILNSSTATVSYCVDDSKANDKNLKTGKLDHYESGDKKDTLETNRMRRSKSGIWQSFFSQTKRGAEECEK